MESSEWVFGEEALDVWEGLTIKDNKYEQEVSKMNESMFELLLFISTWSVRNISVLYVEGKNSVMLKWTAMLFAKKFLFYVQKDTSTV